MNIHMNELHGVGICDNTCTLQINYWQILIDFIILLLLLLFSCIVKFVANYDMKKKSFNVFKDLKKITKNYYFYLNLFVN